jgi:hypothetical protein
MIKGSIVQLKTFYKNLTINITDQVRNYQVDFTMEILKFIKPDLILERCLIKMKTKNRNSSLQSLRFGVSRMTNC